jgi:hypothetical protein
MIVRNDLLPHSYTIPQAHQDALLRIGGKNPFNEPLYRIILMETRVTKASGEWAIWDDSVDLDDRGGMNFKKALELARVGATAEQIEDAITPASPTRVDRGIADVPLYPSEGFCIEKWKPASSFGPPADWPASEGPYPQYGDYELLAGPVPHLPTIAEIEEAIRQNMRNLEERSTSRKDRQLQLLNTREIRMQAEKRRRQQMIEDFVKDGPASLYNRLSLGAGRVIQELATNAGLKGHFGN